MIFYLVNNWRDWLEAHEPFGFLRVFTYVEFRAVIAIIFTFFLVVFMGRRTIYWLLKLKIGGITDELKEIKEWMRSHGAGPGGGESGVDSEMHEVKEDMLEVAGRVLELESRMDQTDIALDRLSKAVRGGKGSPRSPSPMSPSPGGSPAQGDAAQWLSLQEELEELRREVAEKADASFRGAYQVINQEFARHAGAGFELINRESVMGIAGLRRAKQSYHPHHLLEKWRVRLK